MSSTQTPRTGISLAPYLLTVLVITGLWLWHLQYIGVGMIRHYDEFYTYDRSTGFARMGDWFAVYSDNMPTLKKPPLQYWMTGGLLELGVRDVVALRLPSMLFALLTLIATAVLAHRMLPGRPWVMVGSVLLLSSSAVFWPDATSAMLDIGAAFFVVLGLIVMLDAFENPHRWPLFALVVFLGGLQKGPVALAFLFFALIALALTGPLQTRKAKDIVKDRRFAIWIFVTLILAFSWQIFQGLRFPDRDAIQGSAEREMINRFVPAIAEGSARSLETLRNLMLGNEPWLRVIGAIGLLALPFTARRPMLLAFTGILIAFALVMWLASGAVYQRYVLLVLPLLAIAAAGLLSTVLRSDIAGLAASIVLCLALGGPLAPASDLRLQTATRGGATYAEILSPVGSNLQPGESLAICALSERSRHFPPGAINVYAAGTGRYARVRNTDLAQELQKFGYEGGPVRGVCPPDELELIRDRMIGLQTAPLPGGYLEFTATGIRPSN